MDDKRTLIAFLLVGVIFLLMPYYYELVGVAPPAPEPEAVSEARRDSAVARQADPEPEKVEPVAAPASAASAPAATVTSRVTATEPTTRADRSMVLLSPLQRVVVSSRGGVITAIELLEYERAHGGTVNLVPDGGRGLSLTVEDETGRQEVVDLGQVHFEPDQERVAVDPDGTGRLVLRADLGDGRLVEKRIGIRGTGYAIDVDVRLLGFPEGSIAWLHWTGGIALAERDVDLDVTPMKAITYMNETTFDIQVDEDDESESEEQVGDVRFAGVRNKYFGILLSPSSGKRHEVQIYGRPISREPFRDYGFSLGTRWGAVEGAQWSLLLYAGPLELDELAGYEREFSRAMDLGWPVIRQISKVLLHLFVALHEFVPNYGWVIVLFGVIVKILVYPLTHKSYESAARMQEVQPKLMALREKYKNNNQKLSQETMKLYKEEGVNPIGGCLPMLLQMPIFFSLYQVFSSAIQLRQSEWILWITDLSLPDAINIAGFEMHVLPLLMSGAMFFQSKMTMKDPKQAALVYIMPVVMVFIMWDFSSGLVLYWTVFNVMQIGQQLLTNHMKSRNSATAAAKP